MDETDQFDIDPDVITEAATAVDQLADRVQREGDTVAWSTLKAGLE
jgi:hypothetical protein